MFERRAFPSEHVFNKSILVISCRMSIMLRRFEWNTPAQLALKRAATNIPRDAVEVRLSFNEQFKQMLHLDATQICRLALHTRAD
jgi:hypothetical protein